MSKKEADISCGAAEKSTATSESGKKKKDKKNKGGKSTTGKPSKGGKSTTTTGATATEAEPVVEEEVPVVEEEAPAQRLFLEEPDTGCDIYQFGLDVGFANCAGGKNVVCDVICQRRKPKHPTSNLQQEVPLGTRRDYLRVI